MKNSLNKSFQAGALALSALAAGCGTTKQVVKQTTQLVQDQYDPELAVCSQDTVNYCEANQSNKQVDDTNQVTQQTTVCYTSKVVDACDQFSPSYISARVKEELDQYGVCIDTIDKLGHGIVNGLYTHNGRTPSRSALCKNVKANLNAYIVEPSTQPEQQDTVNTRDTQETTQQEVATEESLSSQLFELSYKHTLDYISKNKSKYPYIHALSIHFKKFKSTTITHVMKKMSIQDLSPENVISELQKIFSVHLIPKNYTDFPPKFLELISTFNSFVQVKQVGVHYKYVVESYIKLLNSLREQGLQDIVEVKSFHKFYNNKSKVRPVR